MITIAPTSNFVEWYLKVEDERPRCFSCELYIVKFEGTAEVFEDSERLGILCRHCTHLVCKYETVEDFFEGNDGEVRHRAVEEVIAKERASRAKEFRSERAKKAARTKAERNKAPVRSDDDESIEQSPVRIRVRRPKNPRITKTGVTAR